MDNRQESAAPDSEYLALSHRSVLVVPQRCKHVVQAQAPCDPS